MKSKYVMQQDLMKLGEMRYDKRYESIVVLAATNKWWLSNGTLFNTQPSEEAHEYYKVTRMQIEPRNKMSNWELLHSTITYKPVHFDTFL